MKNQDNKINIVLFQNAYIPALKYGGTERVIYYLAEALDNFGHNVTLLVKGATKPTHIKIIVYDENRSVQSQIPKDTDIIHLHSIIDERLTIPYVVTIHGNPKNQDKLDLNSIFVSRNHADRHNSSSFVLNGLNWGDYSKVDLTRDRDYYHFLGKASWKVKNVKLAIDIAKKSNENIKILGGVRFNFKMGIRWTFTKKASFYGMVGGELKDNLLNGSKGLIFPVLWNEPFGLAIIESLYFGAPIFGTPYGSLPELVDKNVGFLSSNRDELINAVKSNSFNAKMCNEYANDMFNSDIMAKEYLKKYYIVLNNNTLNIEKPYLKEILKDKYLKID